MAAANHALEQFQRRFLAAVTQSQIDLSLPGGGPELWWPEASSVQPGERVLFLGAPPSSLVREAVQLAGVGGSVLAADAEPEEVIRLRAETQGVADGACLRTALAEATDLRTDLERAGELLARQPLRNWKDLTDFEGQLRDHGLRCPLVEDVSIDRVISGPLVNRLPIDRLQLAYQEIARVLRRTGSVDLAALVADEPPPSSWKELLAVHEPLIERIPREEEIVAELEWAGFYGVKIVGWETAPRHVLGGVEVRRVILRGFQGKQGPCLDCHHAVIYRGPWKQVEDDDSHVYRRGQRVAVCEKTYQLLTNPPYKDEFIKIEPYEPVPVELAAPFQCRGSSRRDPKVTKGIQLASPQTDHHEDACGEQCCG